jgi:tRNA pseudouridine32 synthase/23S rRNA pseudouridine746 synthase
VTYFHCFKKDVTGIPLPKLFTYPFYYEPHPLAEIAADQLQQILLKNPWGHPFGLNGEQKPIGKMFGVLVVKEADGSLGFLAAFSGKLAENNHHNGFVPPVFDLLETAGFFKKEEALINELSHKIDALETSADYTSLCVKLEKTIRESQMSVAQTKAQILLNKSARRDKRAEALSKLATGEYLSLEKILQEESKAEQIRLKQLIRENKLKIAEIDNKLTVIKKQISALKQQRANDSSRLQQRIFSSYTFLNREQKEKSLLEIFSQTSSPTPPAGAGECAAPKLLHYAFSKQLSPICIAEFWWGASPISEVRIHKQFYPACRGKCEPILMNHMLQGILLNENPLLKQAEITEIEVVYEDEYLMVVDKPAEFLSVPGKNMQDSVYERIKQMRPDASGPLLVHRLDMSTSGLLVVAKSIEAYKKLQFLFIKRKVEKKYEALLEGVISKPKAGVINLPLRLDIDNRPFQLVCYDFGKAAITEYEVIDIKDNRTRISFKPLSGRTHQLRVHSAHILGLNCPIVGDDLYGKKGERLCLHATELTFIHPFKKSLLTLKSQTPF